LRKRLLTANGGSRVAAKTNIGKLELTKEVGDSVPALNNVGTGPKDGEGSLNNAIAVCQEILADSVACHLHSVRVRHIAAMVDGSKSVDTEVGPLEGAAVDTPLVAFGPCDSVENRVFPGKLFQWVGEHWSLAVVPTDFVLTDPAVPIYTTVATATVRAYKPSAERQFCAMATSVIRKIWTDGRDLAVEWCPLLEELVRIGQSVMVDRLEARQGEVVAALAVEAGPAGVEDLFARSTTLLAGLDGAADLEGTRAVRGDDALRNPPGLSATKVCLLETDAPGQNWVAGRSGLELLRPEVCDMEPPKDCIAVKGARGVKGVALAWVV
jgi:hypothetical protein